MTPVLATLFLLSSGIASPEIGPSTSAPLVAAPQEVAPVCSEGSICVAPKDLDMMLQVLEERRCLDTTTPTLTLDTITVIVDEKGRVYTSNGGDPKPYKVKLSWCTYDIEATGSVRVLAAMKDPPWWGFRFRPKAYLGYLPLRLFDGDPVSGVDAGLMLDIFYVDFVNFNLTAGFRSAGAGLGLDITNNFGAYVGYGFTYDHFDHTVLLGAYFAF